MYVQLLASRLPILFSSVFYPTLVFCVSLGLLIYVDHLFPVVIHTLRVSSRMTD